MPKKSIKERDAGLAIGGGVLLGVGVGFFFLQDGKALYFIGSILIGLGLGLMLAFFLEKN